MPTLSWIKQLENSPWGSENIKPFKLWSYGKALTIDQLGNVFICGGISRPLSESRENKGNYGAFIAKYSTKGQQVWVKVLGSSSTNDTAEAIALDQSGNVIICGSTRQELETGKFKGRVDMFLAKFTPNGEQEWIKQLGTALFDSANAIAVDQWGNIFVSGLTDGELVKGQAKGKSDVFLARYNTKGKQEWIKQIGTSDIDSVKAIAVDHRGNVYICGYTYGALEPGQTKNHLYDAFLVKYTSKGKQKWIKQFGSSSRVIARAIALDQWGHIFISGSIIGELEPGEAKGKENSRNDAFLVKYTSKGKEKWIKQLGSFHDDSANAIAIDQSGHVFICGSTFGELESGEAIGKNDAFLAKYIDDLTSTQYHVLTMKRFDDLSKEIVALKKELYSQSNDLSVIALANEFIKGRESNKISIAEAKKIINEVQGADQVISESGKKTLAFIYSKYPFTEGATELILNCMVGK